MHASNVAQSLFRHRKSSLRSDQNFSDEPANLAARNDNRWLDAAARPGEKADDASVLVSIALDTYAASQEGDAHG